MPKLIYQDPETGLEMSLELGPQLTEMTIGRNPGNELRVNNPSISRKHARITYDVQTGQCMITDLKSSNGTYVNGNRVQAQVLVDGDRVRVGEFPFDYSEVQDAPAFGEGSPQRAQTSMGGFQASQAPPEPPPGQPAYGASNDPFAAQPMGGAPSQPFGAQPYNASGFGAGAPPAAPEEDPYAAQPFQPASSPVSSPSGQFGAQPYTPSQADAVPVYDPYTNNDPSPEVVVGDDDLEEGCS